MDFYEVINPDILCAWRCHVNMKQQTTRLHGIFTHHGTVLCYGAGKLHAREHETDNALVRNFCTCHMKWYRRMEKPVQMNEVKSWL